MEPKEVECLVHTCEEPLVFKNLMKSQLESWNLSDWNKLFQDEKLAFRTGRNEYCLEPQWETTTKTIKGTFHDFLEHTENLDGKEWWYFDYKYLRHLPDMEKVEKNINWANLGVNNLTCSEDGVIWIGSKGAHTCCHKDTYGCNLVYQIYGRYLGVENCYKIILNPGDVLLVPHKWWHYVENLETSISVNNWIGLQQDEPEHVKEAIAQILFSTMSQVLDREDKKIVLNPNMTNDKMSPLQDLLKIIEIYAGSRPAIFPKSHKAEDTLAKYDKFISKVPKLSKEEFHRLLTNQRNRFDSEDVNKKEKSRRQSEGVSEVTIVDFLDALTGDDVLTMISKKILEKVKHKLT